MREHAMAQKVGNRSGMGGRRAGAAQRPTRRERDGESVAQRLRGLLGYFPLVLKLTLAVGIGLVLFIGYRAAASASFFQIRNVEVQGASRVSAQEIEALVQREVSKTGVWNADLAALSGRLERLPWVRQAIVSRVLPDGVRVRITERRPQAVVRTAAGRFRWVDEDAVLLGEMTPTDQMPAFFLRGLSEEDTERARKENIERVKVFLSLQNEAELSGVAERLSEVNLMDVRDMRVQLAGDDSQIELRLGAQEQGKRLRDGLQVLDEHRQKPRGQFISYIDLSYGKKVIGFMTGAAAPTINDGPTVGADETNTGSSQNAAEKKTPEKKDTRNNTKEKKPNTTRTR